MATTTSKTGLSLSVRRAEERFRLVVEASPSAILMVNSEGCITLVNTQTETLFGYERAELLNQPVEMLVPERYRAAHPGHRTGFFQRPSTRAMGAGRDLFGRRKDGTEIPIEIGLNPIVTDEGAFVLASIIDITERKRAEASLRESEQRLQTVIENLSEGLILSAVDGQLLHWNRAALDMHGFANLDEVLLKVPDFTKIFELSDPDGTVLDVEQWPLPRIIRGEHLRNVKTRVRRINSDWERFFTYGGTLVNEVSGQRIAFVTVSDITDRERALAEIHRLNDELELRVLERTTQLEAANKEMEAFSYSASHDLRAPRHLAGYASLLQKNGGTKLDENSRRYVNTIIEESSRMGDLIDHLLNFSRLGRAALQKRPVDLQRLVNEVVANFAVPEGQHIRWTISDLPGVSGDPALLRLVFENLLSNAVKFTRKCDEPQIEIGCSSAGQQFVLFVKDNGEGFDMRYIDKLFGVFQRLHRADESEGNGIGLANVRRIVSRHGGTTWAEGIVGNGATFFITLPR